MSSFIFTRLFLSSLLFLVSAPLPGAEAFVVKSTPSSFFTASSSSTTTTTNLKMSGSKLSEGPWKKFIIKRTIPGVGNMSASELVKAGCGSNKINEDQGCKCVWINSYVIKDGFFCIYAAADQDDVACHAKCLTPDTPFEIFEVMGTLDVTGAYLRHGTCD